MKKSKSS
jgi:hypothetical protein